MGVPGLWKALVPAGKVRSLTELAVVEGFEANPNDTRGFRVGIDTSIWFNHAAYGKGGKNPDLRMLFFRCAKLMRAPFLPLFVFDGPLRPQVKRGNTIRRGPHPLEPKTKEIVEAFGFEHRTAPGEAEAELAYLNQIGVLDGILSDDVDTFLFGATTVIRNPSNNLSGNWDNPVLNSEGKDDKNHTRVYRMQDITEHPEVLFTRGDMIFLALCSGGDYDPSGMTGCGIKIAKGLVRYGFGRSLYEAATNLPRDVLEEFLHHQWRSEIGHQLWTDSKNYIGSKRRSLALTLPDTFPDIDILLSYINPLTSEQVGWENEPLTWSKEPNLAKLATTCEFYFGWRDHDRLMKSFKKNIWQGAVLRILRRGVLELEENRRGGGLVPSTPTRSGEPRVKWTPSKLITKHFSSMTYNPVEDDVRLISKITGQREHAFTDHILEYRLEIRPRQLVLLAKSELGEHEWAPLEADLWGNKGGSEAEELMVEDREVKEEKQVRFWMPASIVRMAEPCLVEEFEQRKKAKQLKKTPRKAKSIVLRQEESETISPKHTPKAFPTLEPLDLDSGAPSDDELPTFKLHTKAPGKGNQTAALPPVDPFAIDPLSRRTPSRLLPQPFPLSFEAQPLPKRRSSIISSDSDSTHPRITKSPRKSAKHAFPGKRLSAVRAPSPTPYRHRPPPHNIQVIDISNDSDSPPLTATPN
ncbi:hypothetical protein K438DRAFT_1674831 [Mycena galopus ATCC 62051]|nr:hypothetical protein K438DRAFT_1674831 [Mycena galopus ATCC 62051]